MADDGVVWSEGLREYLAELPEEQQAKARVFLAKVPEIFAFLRSVGYERPVALTYALAYPDPHFPFSVKVDYLNPRADREFYVGLSRHYEDPPGGEILTSAILREVHKWRPDQTDRRSWGARLQPEMYLENYHPEYDLSKLDLRTYDGPFEERLERCLRAWAEVLQNQLWDIIIGNRWVEGMRFSRV